MYEYGELLGGFNAYVKQFHFLKLLQADDDTRYYISGPSHASLACSGRHNKGQGRLVVLQHTGHVHTSMLLH